MNDLIERTLEKLYPPDKEKYSIKPCAHNRFLNGDYDTLKEFDYELWVQNNPDIMQHLEEGIKNGTYRV